MELKNRRVAAIHDISGFGRGSMTTAIATLSSMGLQALPFPTAVLSSHTGIKGYTFRDLTDDFDAYIAHWKALNIPFDGIYSGFLGSARQTSIVGRFIDEFKGENTLVLVDPVMGDGGRRYATCTEELCGGMKELAGKADVVTPNLTEAGILIGEKDISLLPDTEERIKEWLFALSEMGPKKIVITGLLHKRGKVGVACYDANIKAAEFFYNENVNGYFPGTGDLFASVFLGSMLGGAGLMESAKRAAQFVKEAAKITVLSGEDPMEGVLFEKLLPKLFKTER